jgi:hypothetical protein
MPFRRSQAAAAIAVLTLLAGCTAHGTAPARSAIRASPASTARSSSPAAASSGPLTAANVLDRVEAAASFPGLRGTVTLTEAGPKVGTLAMAGSFQAYLGASVQTRDVQVRQSLPWAAAWSIRTVGSALYCRLRAQGWKDYSPSGPTTGTAEGAGVRHVASQLLVGTDPLGFVYLLQAGHNLTQVSAPAGQYGFRAEVTIGGNGSEYDPDLYTAYLATGITTMTYTATFDQQARPTALTERLSSSSFTVVYHLAITGYTATKVTAPI